MKKYMIAGIAVLIAVIAVSLVNSHGGDPNQTLLEECLAGNVEGVEECLNQGADVNTVDQKGRTPLMHAAVRGNKGVVELLLKRGANIEAKGPKGRTALMYASNKGHAEVVQLLVERGAMIRARDKEGKTSLKIATEKGHQKVVNILKKRSQQLLVDGDVMSASFGGYAEVVQELLKSGANIEVKDDKFGLTPLMWAAGMGQTEVVELLVKSGANIEARDNAGWTPLMWAAVTGHAEVVELLGRVEPISKRKIRTARLRGCWQQSRGIRRLSGYSKRRTRRDLRNL